MLAFALILHLGFGTLRVQGNPSNGTDVVALNVLADGHAQEQLDRMRQQGRIMRSQEVAPAARSHGTLVQPAQLLQTEDAHDTEHSGVRDLYLSTVRMGLLGGLNHFAYTDPGRQATTNPSTRNECLSRDGLAGEVADICILKWDGDERLQKVGHLYSLIRKHNVPGDLMECGVWRGGITVYMKALLRAYEDNSRKVWVSDSFEGVPDAKHQRALYKSRHVPKEMQEWDLDQWGPHITEPGLDGKEKVKNLLTVEEELVRDNFKRFGLLDKNVRFLKGYFDKTLPHVSKKGLKHIALLRIDGDLYSSTMDVLVNLYPLVSPGGFILFDDYPLPQARKAIEDFFKAHHLDIRALKVNRITRETDNSETSVDGINAQAYFQKPW